MMPLKNNPAGADSIGNMSTYSATVPPPPATRNWFPAWGPLPILLPSLSPMLSSPVKAYYSFPFQGGVFYLAKKFHRWQFLKWQSSKLPVQIGSTQVALHNLSIYIRTDVANGDSKAPLIFFKAVSVWLTPKVVPTFPRRVANLCRWRYSVGKTFI